MERLGVQYDVLPRESEILHLKFWDAAFQQLRERGAIHLASAGKNVGCWVMKLPERPPGPGQETQQFPKLQSNPPGAEPQETGDSDDDAKVIVRSNVTVTYVGKDIAYQLWKFGLLGKDFHYAKWPNAPKPEDVWATTSDAGDPKAPPFGQPAATVYNVIDSRQAYLQDVVA